MLPFFSKCSLCMSMQRCCYISTVIYLNCSSGCCHFDRLLSQLLFTNIRATMVFASCLSHSPCLRTTITTRTASFLKGNLRKLLLAFHSPSVSWTKRSECFMGHALSSFATTGERKERVVFVVTSVATGSIK